MTISDIEDYLHIYNEDKIREEILEEDERRIFTCPSCAGANLTLQGRCVVCTDCGWSSCVL